MSTNLARFMIFTSSTASWSLLTAAVCRVCFTALLLYFSRCVGNSERLRPRQTHREEKEGELQRVRCVCVADRPGGKLAEKRAEKTGLCTNFAADLRKFWVTNGSVRKQADVRCTLLSKGVPLN